MTEFDVSKISEEVYQQLDSAIVNGSADFKDHKIQFSKGLFFIKGDLANEVALHMPQCIQIMDALTII